MIPYEDVEIDIVNPILLLSHIEEDTMLWDQAMKANDKDQFIKAAMSEVESHEMNHHWQVVPMAEIPPNISLPSYSIYNMN